MSTPSLRVSDAEREAVALELRTHHDAGRLSVEEFSERLESAYSAVTREDLELLLGDLPRLVSAVPARRRARLPGAPGMRPFAVHFEVARPPGTVVDTAMRTLAPGLARAGFAVVSRGEREVVFARSFRPAWTFAVALLLIPLGLFALLHKEEARVVLAVTPKAGGSSSVDVFGSAPALVRSAVAELADSGAA